MRDRLPCQLLFGEERGAQIIAAVEEDLGGPCPCRSGRTCPLAPSLVREGVTELEPTG